MHRQSAVGDFNGDGIKDLAVYTTSGTDIYSLDFLPETNWAPLDIGRSSSVSSLLEYEGDLYVGCNGGGTSGNERVSKWDGSGWNEIGHDLQNGTVWDLCEFDGQLVAGGSFSTAGGSSADGVAAWDGANWQPLGSEITIAVHTLVEFDGQLVAGGTFNAGTGSDVDYVAAWDGAAWRTLGTEITATVEYLVVYNDELIAFGLFSSVGGSTVDHVARWGWGRVANSWG